MSTVAGVPPLSSPLLSPTPALVAQAERIGSHALGAFLSLLLVSMLASGLACWMAQRRRLALAAEAEPDEPRLAFALALGFVAILGASSLFAWIASNLGDGRTLGLADQALTDAIARDIPRGVVFVFSWLTRLGDFATVAPVAVLVAVLLWLRSHRGLALGWSMALVGIVLLNPALKQIFARARPLHDHGLAHETSYSFPSGHSAGAMVSYGMLVYLALRLLPQRWHVAAAMAGAAAIVTIACSRIFLQVHFASDVVAGLLTGLAWLVVCIGGLEFAKHRQRRRAR